MPGKSLTYAGRYRKGKRFENKVAEHLINLGYHAVLSPGSKGSHKIDVTAVNCKMYPSLILVQCKTNGIIGPDEWDAVYLTAEKTGGSACIASSPRPGMIEFTRIYALKLRNRQMKHQSAEPCPGLNLLPKRERDKS